MLDRPRPQRERHTVNEPARQPLPFVILRHSFEGAPKRDHFDLLIETEPGTDPDARTLIAFRSTDLDAQGLPTSAERLEAHRRRYLTYEGPVTGNRGSVTRVRTGTARLTEREDAIDLRATFDDDPAHPLVRTIRRSQADIWLFSPA